MANFKRDIGGRTIYAGAEYEWRLRREPQWCTVDGWKGVALAIRHVNGQREAILEWPFSGTHSKSVPHRQRPTVSPAMLEKGIATALQAGLLDSHIVELGESGECVAGVLELSPSVEHDDRTGFAVIAGPASQSGADPGGVGERAFWMRIFLTGGLAFELGAKRLQQGRIFELEGVARRSQPLDGAAIARMDQLLNRDGGDQRGGGQFAERLIVGDAQRFDIKALRLHRKEQLLDRPAASIKIGDFERLLHNANRTGGYETPMNGFAWRGIDLPEVDDIHCDRLGPALVDAVLRLDYFHAIKAHHELGLPRSPPRFGGQRQEGLARRRQRVDARKQKRIALNAAVLRRAQHKIDAGRAQGESREYVAFAVGDHRYLLRVRADLRRRARPLDPAPAFLLFDRPRPSLRLAPALALQKLSVDKTKNRPVLRIHRDCGMQIETAAARRSDDRRVLDRQHMPAHATRPGARAGGGEHLLGRHRLVAQKTGQTNFPSPIPAQPTHANPIAARRDKAAMQKDPPFSRRRSPNRPSPSSSIANLPTNQRRESDFKNHRNRRCVNAVAPCGGGSRCIQLVRSGYALYAAPRRVCACAYLLNALASPSRAA